MRLHTPSPPLVISCIALFVALGGVGYAAATGSIDGREIQNNAVATKDLRNNDVRGKDIRRSTIAGSDIAPNTLTGSDISETSLGKVPSAGQADIAGTATSANTANSAGSVGGLTLRKIDYRMLNATPTQIFNAGGLQISAACPAGSLSLSARTTKQDSAIYSNFDDLAAASALSGNVLEDRDFDTSVSFDLLAGNGGSSGGADDPGLLHFGFYALDGTYATGSLTTDEDFDPAGACRVTGHVTVG